MLARTRPRYMGCAAGQIDPYLRLKKPLASPDGRGCARTCAACQGLADAPLEHAQADATAVHDLHEAHVGAPWKAAMALDLLH